MLHFVSLGSGSSGNCSLLYTDKACIMIDAGTGPRILKRHLTELGLSMSMVNAIIITHDHADHVKAVGTLSKKYQIPVYATAKVHSGIDSNWSVKNKVPQELRRTIEKDRSFTVGEFEITPFHVPHDSSDNVGYQIVCGTTCFVLMTDIGHLTDQLKKLIGQANYLVIEADYELEMLEDGPYPEHLKKRILSPYGHQSNSECGQALAENATPRLRHVWLCHLSNENNHPELAEKTVKQILRRHGIIAGNDPYADFKLDVLKRATPSPIYDLP